MALFDDLSDIAKLQSRFRSKCSVCSLMENLETKELEKFQQVIADPNVTKAAIARVLQSNGHQISAGTLTRHVRRECLKN